MPQITHAERAVARTHLHRLRVAAVGFVALLFLAAAVDGRNAVLDRTSPAASSVDRTASPLTTDELVREMMTHD